MFVHANVLRFVCALPIDDGAQRRLCIVTEVAGEGSLWHLLCSRPVRGSRVQLQRKSTWSLFAFTEPAARSAFRQALLALQYCHFMGCTGAPLAGRLSSWGALNAWLAMQ